MARVCQVTGKGPMVGNNVSHANNKKAAYYEVGGFLEDRRNQIT